MKQVNIAMPEDLLADIRLFAVRQGAGLYQQSEIVCRLIRAGLAAQKTEGEE